MRSIAAIVIASSVLSACMLSACSLLIDVDALTSGPADAGMSPPDAEPADLGVDAGVDAGVDPCADGIPNGDETGIDCGGSCGPCMSLSYCERDADCASGSCFDGLCRDRCDNGVADGNESDIDCGGSCAPCGYDYACEKDSDCASAFCYLPEHICVCAFGADPGPIGMVPVVAENQIYCINYVEVTRGAYALFLEHVARQEQDVQELARRSCRELLASPYVTSGKELEPLLFVPPSPETAGLPITYVSYCQAKAYCEFYGHRLCGPIAGRPVGDGYTGPSASGQWYSACSEDGLRDLPYVRGSTTTAYDGMACNGLDAGYFTALYVGSLATCVGGGSQYLYDMSGNVMEWEDECEDGACRLRGGSYLYEEEYLRCSSAIPSMPEYQAADVGFRCCSAAAAY